MSSNPLRMSGRSRNRVIAAAAVAAASGAAWLIRTNRPQPPEVAPAPPRIGHSRGSMAADIPRTVPATDR